MNEALKADPEAEEISSEAQALADIAAWSKSCPQWQRDALRRLCLQGELTEEDLAQLARLCKGEGAKAVPLAKGHIPDPKAAMAAVTLRSVHSVENVNALAQGERLTFDKIGLTIIYGDNGAGKSGYARVLKKVCRARSPADETIHSNHRGDLGWRCRLALAKPQAQQTDRFGKYTLAERARRASWGLLCGAFLEQVSVRSMHDPSYLHAGDVAAPTLSWHYLEIFADDALG